MGALHGSDGHRGTSRREGRGVLVEDREAVARYGARNLAIGAPKGHRITRDDLAPLSRGMVRLDLDAPA